MADHLAHQPVDDYQSLNFEFPDEDIMIVTDCEVPGPDEGPEEGSGWSMHFDGASNALGNGIGAVIISPKGTHTPLTARLCFNCTNNMAEYEACVVPQNLPSHILQDLPSQYFKISPRVAQFKGLLTVKN